MNIEINTILIALSLITTIISVVLVFFLKKEISLLRDKIENLQKVTVPRLNKLNDNQNQHLQSLNKISQELEQLKIEEEIKTE